MRWLLTAALVFSIVFLLIPNMAMAEPLAQAPAPTAAPGTTTSSGVVAAAALCSTPYTVVPGDTLTGIAFKCGVTYTSLLAANAGISNPNRIFPGQQINIPQSGPGIPPTGGQRYTVVAGDRLFRIAQRFNTTVTAIVNANPWITNPNLIYPGWVITIPTGPGIPPTGGQTYTGVAGDTLSGIAFRFNTTVTALLSANPSITNPNLIYPGWVIIIR